MRIEELEESNAALKEENSTLIEEKNFMKSEKMRQEDLINKLKHKLQQTD